jgi:type IV pilus assembly protein PilW
MKPAKTHGGTETGLTLIEMLVALVIALSVMAGAIQIFVQSKSNFLAERELAGLQENARFVFKLFQDEVHMAGFNSCGGSAQNVANSIKGATTSWELNGTGLQGYEHEAGLADFPVQIRADVAPITDSIVIRRTESPGYLVIRHLPATSRFDLNKKHDIAPGDIVAVATPDCQQLGYFQAVSAANKYVTHTADNTVVPGNCTADLAGTFFCGSGIATSKSYPPGSILMKLISHAYYVGPSEVQNDMPALFRERLGVVTKKATTWSEELIQGVENMQVQYGIDLDGNDAADIYINANDGRIDWKKITSVQLSLRLRSLLPFYPGNVPYEKFMGLQNTDGEDRYMRQTFTTTISLRN